MSLRPFSRALLSSCLVLSACATKPARPAPTPQIETRVSAAANTNPDASGRPSPVVVRVYQLRADADFNRVSDFFALYDREQQTLGSSLTMREERTLSPGQQLQMSLPSSAEVHYIAALAALHDLPSSHWRAIVKLPVAAPGKGPAAQPVTIQIRRSAVSVSTAG
jgi:type VI secretion system protein VasD